MITTDHSVTGSSTTNPMNSVLLFERTFQDQELIDAVMDVRLRRHEYLSPIVTFACAVCLAVTNFAYGYMKLEMWILAGAIVGFTVWHDNRQHHRRSKRLFNALTQLRYPHRELDRQSRPEYLLVVDLEGAAVGKALPVKAEGARQDP